jgi:hypothetical protein
VPESFLVESTVKWAGPTSPASQRALSGSMMAWQQPEKKGGSVTLTGERAGGNERLRSGSRKALGAAVNKPPSWLMAASICSSSGRRSGREPLNTPALDLQRHCIHSIKNRTRDCRSFCTVLRSRSFCRATLSHRFQNSGDVRFEPSNLSYNARDTFWRANTLRDIVKSA